MWVFVYVLWGIIWWGFVLSCVGWVECFGGMFKSCLDWVFFIMFYKEKK